MQYDEAQQLQGRHRPENGCREKGTYMWETDAVPLSRFGEVEWFHQVYLMSEGEPLNSLGDIRVGRNADCEDDEYIVAVSGACPAPVDLETARFVESWAVKIPISDDQLQVIKRISTYWCHSLARFLRLPSLGDGERLALPRYLPLRGRDGLVGRQGSHRTAASSSGGVMAKSATWSRKQGPWP